MEVKKSPAQKPNILMIMVDQMRFPPLGNGSNHGFIDPIKHILSFKGTPHDNNEFKKFFPGFWALRENAVVMNNHRIASSACVPSRTALFTGQYGTHTHVTQTDGVFKEGTDSKFCWLKENTYPTLGNWMRGNGYSTHYFGKWHITGEATSTLEAYGFSDWNLSAPDPHGTLPNNLGYYRDYQFEDLICSFLRRQGIGVPYNKAHAKANVINAAIEKKTNINKEVHGPSKDDEPKPWFAVSSFTNPHDIASYPGLPSSVYKSNVGDAEYTLAVPPKDAKGAVPFGGTMSITLNPLGFPQNNANVPLSWDEDLLDNKPSCQFDYKYKMGLSLVAKSGRLMADKAEEDGQVFATPQDKLDYAVNFTLNTNKTGLPFALTENPEIASRSFLQYYGYLLHEVDQHISKALQTLEESGQAENTIVMFCPDHGEYGSSHGTLMEKWHSAYEEIIHVPFVVRLPTNYHQVPEGLKQVNEVTSHMDILPTILGLSNTDNTSIATIKQSIPLKKFSHVHNPVGIDLSPVILGQEEHVIDPSTGRRREGVLFMTYDTITNAFIETSFTPENTPPIDDNELTNYQVYTEAVKRVKANTEGTYPTEVENLSEGSVRQPNNIHAVVDNQGWKLVEYFDPAGEHDNEYEIYDLNTDPNELTNLLQIGQPFPTPIKKLPLGINPDVEFFLKAKELKVLLDHLKKTMLFNQPNNK